MLRYSPCSFSSDIMKSKGKVKISSDTRSITLQKYQTHSFYPPTISKTLVLTSRHAVYTDVTTQWYHLTFHDVTPKQCHLTPPWCYPTSIPSNIHPGTLHYRLLRLPVPATAAEEGVEELDEELRAVVEDVRVWWFLERGRGDAEDSSAGGTWTVRVRSTRQSISSRVVLAPRDPPTPPSRPARLEFPPANKSAVFAVGSSTETLGLYAASPDVFQPVLLVADARGGSNRRLPPLKGQTT